MSAGDSAGASVHLDTRLRTVLDKLGINSLKKEQCIILSAIAESHDLFVQLPTGYGKSLAFVLAPFLKTPDQPTCIIIIMPLRALMREQCDRLLSQGFSAVCLSSDEEVASLAENSLPTYTFISPELFLARLVKRIRDMPKATRLQYSSVFVDESHCIVNWGQGSGKTVAFRAAYGRLGEARSFLPHCNFIGMTATATPKVRGEIMSSLQLDPKSVVVCASPDKPNIRYNMIRTPSKDICEEFDWIVKYLEEKGDKAERVLIFCSRLKHIGSLYCHLVAELGTSQVQQFHKNTPQSIQQSIIEEFKGDQGALRVVICSAAFSMGMDIPGLHHIVHYGIPASIDSYLQECGRVGRDGRQSFATLIYHPSSLHGTHMSEGSKAYCKLTTCRRKFLLKQYGAHIDSAAKPSYRCCDICAAGHSCCNCQPTLPTCPQQCTCVRSCCYSLIEEYSEELPAQFCVACHD